MMILPLCRIVIFCTGATGLANLVACSASAQVGDAMFPLTEGRSWKYHSVIAYDDGSESMHEDLELTARGSEKIGEQTAWRRRSDHGVDYWLRFDDTGTFRVAYKTDVDPDPKLDSALRYVLKKPYAIGTEWTVPTSAFVLEKPNEFRRQFRTVYKPFPMKFRIESINEKVETPAGKFDACLKVAGVATIKLYVDATGVWDDVPLYSTEWYCPNVGLTQIVRREKSTSKLIRGGELTMKLTAWK
jgi:hypothetical protein